MLEQHEIDIRVRYNETDGQGRVHHAQYLNYFERGRVEMLRASGFSYKELEQGGLMLVVSQIRVRYILPAEFDDELKLVTRVLYARGARLEHQYQLFRGSDLLVEADTEIACIDRTGKVRRLPSYLQWKATRGDTRDNADAI
jgi:acyl-CoA thioester hydrolase